MVDEIQSVRAGAEHILKSLHLATYGLPVVPLYAGLGNSGDVLDALNLSRLNIGNGVHDIGCLSIGSAIEAVEMMLVRFGIDRTGVNVDWPSVIAKRSDGWPQHLHNGMRSLGFELLRIGGRLAHVNADVVEAKEREYRFLTYKRRMSPEMEDAGLLVARIMREIPEEGMTKSAIKGQILRQARPADDPDGEGLWLPKDMDVEDFFSHLIRKGTLQDMGGYHYHCPIPSLRRFLVQRSGLD